MKKIMFSDQYGLTQAVLEGRKVQTRRVIKDLDKLLFYDFGIDDNGHYEFGNYFQTREEAEDIRNKIIKLFKERK